MRFAIILFAAFTCGANAHADAIAEVRAALARFNASQDVKLRVEQTLTTSSDEEGSKPESGRAVFFIHASSEGISLTYPAAELARAEREERANQQNPESPTGTRGALSEVNPVQASEFANFAPKLGRLLQQARIVSDQPGTYQGSTVRHLVLAIAPNLSQTQKKHVRDIQHQVTLRIGSDNVPLACESSFTVKARFLLIRVEHTTKESWTLSPQGSRLVVTRHAEESGGSAMGRGYRKQGGAVLAVQ
ncbi:MAG TPA: hypothetical protein VMS12_02920 [Thermoanaerobaculia bacterium]|nr:hypothetical protein [Thermoanaerobaculia bacterium]